MQQIAWRFTALDDQKIAEEYNFEHFRAKHFVSDVQGTWEQRAGYARVNWRRISSCRVLAAGNYA